MKPEYWKRVQDLFLEAVELAPRPQKAFLDMACGDDPRLRREVESLLESDRRDTNELEAVVEDLAQSVLLGSPVAGSRLGAWRVGRKIGQGGMGEVYLATRDDDQYKKQAAIKLVKHGMDSSESLARFRHERQILAGLEHPYIARLIDGGTAPDGRPYLVMEYVEGQPIDVYCRDRGLNVRQRCALFLKVCEAVSFAHRSLVVHRDLKPGNIFITGDGTPKLLDFGVAKLLEPDHEASGAFTIFAGRMLTPDYASPEQVRGLPVTTATDVYSLGCILFELLTGVKAHQLKGTTASEMEQAICVTEMSRPSTIAGGLPGADRGWIRQLAGDLDNIVLMAMRKEPERRYASVEQFSADVRRYLEGHPVQARGDSFSYRSSKFVRRNWLAVVSGVAIFVSLSAGIVFTAREARRANAAESAAISESVRTRQERDRAIQAESAAQRERNRALEAERASIAEKNRAIQAEQAAKKEREAAVAVTDFLRNDVLGRANPEHGVGKDITVRAALDEAASRIEGKFKPEVEAVIRSTIGESYFGLSRYTEARQQWQHALALVEASQGPRSAEGVGYLVSIGAAYRREGKPAEAQEQYRKALEIGIPLLGEKNSTVLTAMGNLATAYKSQGKFAESEALNRRVLRIQREVLGPDSPDTLRTMSNLANNYSSEGKSAEALALWREVLAIRRRVHGSEHFFSVQAMTGLATAELTINPAEAASLLTQALELQERSLGAQHDDTLVTMASLATVRMFEGKMDEAETLAAKIVDLRVRTLGPLHPSTSADKLLLGEILLRRAKYTDAEARFRDLLGDFERTGYDGWRKYAVSLLLGASLAGQQRYDEATPLIARSHEALLQRKASIPAFYYYLLDPPERLAALSRPSPK